MSPETAHIQPSALPELTPERPEDFAAVEALIDSAFGPGRFAKAAERLREGAEPLRRLSFTAWNGPRLVGCVRLWPILIGERRALLLGPFAVDPAWRGLGLGKALIRRACQAAAEDGWDLVLLVGDAPYFGQLGFAPCADKVAMPGPADRRRVLWRELKPDAAEGAGGPVRPARS